MSCCNRDYNFLDCRHIVEMEVVEYTLARRGVAQSG